MDDTTPLGGAAQLRAAAAPAPAEERSDSSAPRKPRTPKPKKPSTAAASADAAAAPAEPADDFIGPPRRGRERGRPPVGRPTNIRMPLADQQFALEIGDDSLAKGVRLALAIARKALRPTEDHVAPDLTSLVLPRQVVDQVADAFGEGSFARGIGVLMKAAHVLGHDTVLRLGKGGGDGAGRVKD